MGLVLLKNATILNSKSKHHLKKRDLLIKDGVIVEIKASLKTKKATILESKSLHVSGGWCDIGCFNGEPGFEYREDLESLTAAASQGGYTHIAPFPTSSPATDSKSQLQYITHRNSKSVVTILPIANVSSHGSGQDISEIIDLSTHGAVAFSDGYESYIDHDFLVRGLQYLESIGGVYIHPVKSKSSVNKGHINEGKCSVALGLEGIPAYTEEIDVDQLLSAIDYAGGRVLLHNVSLSSAIRKVKKKDDLFISTSFLHLLFDEEAVQSFNVNFKVLPPLRTSYNLTRLAKDFESGKIQIITSNHKPLSKEEKDEPFGQSDFGASTLECVYSALNTHGKNLSQERIIHSLSEAPYEALRLDAPVIEAGQKANLTFYDPTITYECSSSHLRSKSKNNPFLGQELKGRIIGTMNFDKLEQNSTS